MAYSWDAELIGDMNQRQKATTFHETDFLKAYVKTQASHIYLPTPKQDDYLTLRQRGSLEGITENLYGLNNFRSTPNTTYERTGTYDLASKLDLYNPVTSFTLDYVPERKVNLYESE